MRGEVKKIMAAGTTARRALLALRELRLQRHCAHRNVLPIQQVLRLRGEARLHTRATNPTQR